MHYLDEGEGDPVLLLHGEPTWCVPLPQDDPASSRRPRACVAPDYFGFGRSDKPTDPAGTPTTATSRRSRGSSTSSTCATSRVVVQDWGGPIGFRFAVENPERIARLVVMNTGIGARAPNEEWLRFQAFMRRVGTEIVAGQLIRLTLVQPTTDEVIAGYDAPFPVPESRVGHRPVPRARRDELRSPLRAGDARRARAAARASTGPRSCSSATATRSSRGEAAEAMAELLPNAELDPPVEGAGHFLQEDRGEALGARIASWIAV